MIDEEEYILSMPKVRTSDSHYIAWDRENVINQILTDTQLCNKFYGYPSASRELAEDVAKTVEELIEGLDLKYLKSSMVREFVCLEFLKRGMTEYHNACMRVGTSLHDAHTIDVGTGYGAHDNANLQANPETSHKHKADKMSKEQYLLMMPPKIADAHLKSYIHIHDLEYFGTRSFCMDASTTIPVSDGKQIKLMTPSEMMLHPDKSISKTNESLYAFTPRGFQRITKITRRDIDIDQMYEILSVNGKSVKLTGEHNVPVLRNGKKITIPVKLMTLCDQLYTFNVHEIAASSIDEKEFQIEDICKISPVTPTNNMVYDIFLEGDGTDESHTFITGDGILIHNCMDSDLRYLFYYGFMPDGKGSTASVSSPAMNPEVAVLHAVKYLAASQTNFAGGQGYYNFLTFMAPYFEGMPYKEIKQFMQMMVYELTQMLVARGGQAVFSSLQLSPGVPTLWRDVPVVYKGRIWNGENDVPLRTYGDFEREVRIAFKALMDVMIEGDYWGKPFNFPKPEISIEPDFVTESDEIAAWNAEHPDVPTYKELYMLSFELAAKFGTPYFDNQIPAYRGAGKGISCYQCCAYNFSSNIDEDDEFYDKIYFRNGAHFSMGSLQVVTLNCPRAAYDSGGDVEKLVRNIKNYMNVAKDVFIIKKRWIDEIISADRLPFVVQRPRDPITGELGSMAVDVEGLVCTIGVLGFNEMVHHITGYQLHESKEAQKVALYVLAELNKYAKQLSEEVGMKIVVARTPAETTCQRFAVSDLLNPEYEKYARNVVRGDIDTFDAMHGVTRDLPVYYTNGTHVAVDAPISLIERINIENPFFVLVQGGNILHIWLGEAHPEPRGLYEFCMNIATKKQIGYFALTKDMTVPVNQYSWVENN